ncbi:MAC/perforin domain-containing protein [Bacteroides thetaiotaomicron]|uniref:MAC/perforin domain-containing protein n=1 Tax=Bacteroides thetaiotaomicron TaxID=818 RepID=UPI003568F6EF
MKQYNIFATIIMSIISFSSCTNDIEKLAIIPTEKGQNTGDNIILQERNPNLPLEEKLILSKPQTRKSNSGKDEIFLGYSYKIKDRNHIQGSINSLGFPIIDIDSIRKYRPSYLQEKLITVTETNISTYNNLDKYLYDSRFGKKVSSEFTFNPKVFATEKKEAITKLFGNIEKATYGELEVSFIKGQSTLNHLPSSRLWYISQFQNHIFTNILYNAPMASILNEFGEFILTDYFTGGKVYALFASKAKEGTTAQQKEDDMYTSINTSVINLNNATSINLGFNGSNFDATTTFKSTDTYLDMKTFGGEVSQSVAINTKVSNINIDLTPWRYSLKDMANNTMIDIADNSLYPLSAFVLEQNFKQRLDDTFNEILPANKELVPPRIEIVRVLARTTPSNEALYDVAAVLVTRQTDRIILSDAMASSATDEELRKNENNEVFIQKVEKIATEKSKFFSSDIEISYNKDTKLNPTLKSPLSIELTGFNERNFYRFYYEKTNIEYIYDPATHLCLSYYINKGDDRILDIYGIRNWIESLPEKKISITTLANSYKIIGL